MILQAGKPRLLVYDKRSPRSLFARSLQPRTLLMHFWPFDHDGFDFVQPGAQVALKIVVRQ